MMTVETGRTQSRIDAAAASHENCLFFWSGERRAPHHTSHVR
jgi:hypothetical protein